MEVRVQQVAYGIVEAIAAYNLLKYVRKNDEEERLRMAAGATMAGLGYVFGPDLHERITHFGDHQLADGTKERLIYAAGGAALGMFLGNKVGTEYLPKRLENVIAQADRERIEHPSQPGGLVTVASAGWLGYSLFFDGKTKEEQNRHLWGLGAGAVGYMYGPELLRKMRDLPLPKAKADEAIQVYANGSAALGTVAGGLLGWYKGMDWLK